MILNTKAPPLTSSEWVQIWRIGTSNHIRSGGYTGTMEDYVVKMPGTAYAPFEYDCDFYLEDNKHIIKISKRHDQINNASCLYFTKDDNTEIIGSSYIEDDRDGSMQNPSSVLSPAGNYVNGKWYVYDFYYFKKAPEGDFKTWLENNCRRIV